MSIGIEEYQRRLQQVINLSVAKVTEAAVVPAANKLLGKIINRISIEGKNSSGRQIGTYSQNPSYYTKDQFVKTGAFKARGKNDAPKGKKKKTKKSMYLAEGYKQLRKIQGMESGKVNLFYSGSLLGAYRMQPTQNGVVLGLIDEKSAKIREGLEEGRRRKLGYGKVFQATFTELDNYKKEVTKVTNDLISRTFNGTI